MKNSNSSRRARAAFFLLFLISLWSFGHPAYADQIVTIPLSRLAAGCAPGTFTSIDQSYILTEAADPSTASAVLLLFPGGGGKLRVADNELDINSNNFLVRTRHLFAAQGFHVAVMDAATDFLTCAGGLRNRRTSDKFTSDVQAVADDLRARYPGLPLWVVGTSRGSTAAAQAGVFVAPAPDGVVLTSSLTVMTTATVFDVPLDLITVPTLIVVHKDDGCSVTPASGAMLIKQALTSAAKVKTRQFEGGFPALNPNPCQALTPHGYIGLEPKVVKKIVKWIRHNS